MGLLQLALLVGTASALKYPYITARSLNASDVSSVAKRDDPGFWSASFHDGGCGGPASYGGYDDKPYACYNLVHDKPWNSINIGTNGGTDLMFFEDLDCCTTSSDTPCSIYTGYQRDTCVTSIGSGSAGSAVAKSFAVVNHAFNGNSGPADRNACAAAGGPACQTNPDKGGCPSKRSSDISVSMDDSHLEACEKAPNCETWVNPKSNRTQIRFKEGMGPSSDWYHHNIRMQDPWSSFNEDRFFKRDCPSNQAHYNVARRTDVIQYGFENSDITATMKEHCLSNTCKATWRTDETGTKDGFIEYFQLEYDGDGQFDEGQLDYFLDALRANAKTSHDGDESYGQPDELGDTGHNYYGSTFINVNRFQGGGMQGFISLEITFDPDSPDTCDFVKDIISGAAGEVSSIGGGFFGNLIGQACKG